MVLFYIWLNTYFVSSSLSAPSTGGPASRPSSDQWCPVPSKSGTRQDGSDLGMRCFVSMVGVSDDGGGGRCITVSLPRTELDRIGQPRVEDMVRSDFTVRLHILPYHDVVYLLSSSTSSFVTAVAHTCSRSSSVNFRGARHFCPKNMYEKITNCPNFTCFLPEKLSKYPNFYYIFPKN